MNLFLDNFELLEEKSELLKTMGHPLRLSIVELLSNNPKMSVTEIYTELEIEQAVASHHLRIMKNGGVVISEKDGKNSFYSLTHDNIKIIYESIFSF